MKYLLDTCVVSELIKKKTNKKVLKWIKTHDENTLYVSVLTFGEIAKGIEKVADQQRKKLLKLWVEDDLKVRFEGRILDVNLDVATKWGEIQGLSEKSGKPMPTIDGLLAITGLVNNCIVVTKNISDMVSSTAELVNPWLD